MFPYIHWVLLFLVLLLVNEVCRKSKWFTLLIFVAVPLVLTFTVWIETGNVEGASTNTWFHWAKLYSVIIAAIGFTWMRYTNKNLGKFAKFFPALILGINIAEAVLRDFELGLANGGSYHFMNGIAGILSIIAMSGWLGIYIEKDKKRDIIWRDMTVLWIIAYDVWNFAYIWFCIPEHAAYGIAVLLSCTIPSLFIKKHTWVQARAFTLAFWMMYLFTFTSFVDAPENVIMFTDNTTILTFVGALSLVLNGIVVWIHYSRKIKAKNFKWGAEVHPHTEIKLEESQ